MGLLERALTLSSFSDIVGKSKVHGHDYLSSSNFIFFLCSTCLLGLQNNMLKAFPERLFLEKQSYPTECDYCNL